jgi:apolipoprotein D and lipocalin family protein
MPEGELRVVNRCRLENGQMDQAIGVARQIGGDSSAKLEVRFAPAWLSFLPFVWGDYWIVDLDGAYELAAVSEPKREYLWILSRSTVVNETRYAALLGRLTAMGLDVAQAREKRFKASPESYGGQGGLAPFAPSPMSNVR